MAWGYSPSGDKLPPTLTHTQWFAMSKGLNGVAHDVVSIVISSHGPPLVLRHLHELSEKKLRTNLYGSKTECKGTNTKQIKHFKWTIIKHHRESRIRNREEHKKTGFDLQMELIHLQGQSFLGDMCLTFWSHDLPASGRFIAHFFGGLRYVNINIHTYTFNITCISKSKKIYKYSYINIYICTVWAQPTPKGQWLQRYTQHFSGRSAAAPRFSSTNTRRFPWRRPVWSKMRGPEMRGEVMP